MLYQPDFEGECSQCGASPTVIVVGHQLPDTKLCGFHFFHNRDMIEWEDWNEGESDDEHVS